MTKISRNESRVAPCGPHQVGAGRAAWLQMAPGIASLPVFALLAWLLTKQGIPNIFALALTILIAEVPVSWAIMVRQVRLENGGRFSFALAFPWNTPLGWWRYLVIGVPVILLSMAMIAGVGPRVQALLLEHVFSWVPNWFVMSSGPEMLTGLSQELVLALWILILVSMVLVGGFTQELYSRGFLLPRMERFGAWAPLYNALLFAVFHLVAPWSWLPFFLMTIPWAYLVWWRRSIRIGLFIHVGMLALQWVGISLILFGLVPVPE